MCWLPHLEKGGRHGGKEHFPEEVTLELRTEGSFFVNSLLLFYIVFCF